MIWSIVFQLSMEFEFDTSEVGLNFNFRTFILIMTALSLMFSTTFFPNIHTSTYYH